MNIPSPLNLLFVLLSIFTVASCSFSQTEKQVQTEVLVIGGTTGGTSAGIQSARLKARTLIVEETTWLGGMITAAGVSATDGNHELSSGIWNEFREKLRKHYGGAAALSTGWVSETQFEPHVGDSIFKAMAAAEKNLSVLYGYHVVSIQKEGNKVCGAQFRNSQNNILTVKANVVIDATDLGDGLAMAGAAYDLGMESKNVTGEIYAPDQPNSIVQDLTWAAVLKDFGQGTDKTIKKPLNYNPELYRGSCAMTVDSILIDCQKMLTYGKLPDNKYMINWPRHGNDIYLNVVEMDWAKRNEELKKAKERTLGFIYYIQTELGYKNIGLANDEFPSQDHLALVPYHREGRRLRGVQRLTINHVKERYSGTPLYRTGISVGDYPVDHHHACNPEAPKIHFPAIPSFNIPLGALIPEKMDGLIVCDKAISVSNLINGATRLQPCVLLTGQAAGALAAVTVQKNQNVRDVNVRELQQILLDAGAYLMPLYDIKPSDRDFQNIQRATVSGILKVRGEPYKWANRTWFSPDSIITVKEFSEGLNAYNSTVKASSDESLLSLRKASTLLNNLLKRETYPEIIALLEKKTGNKLSPDSRINKRDLSVVVDALIQPFKNSKIGLDGQY